MVEMLLHACDKADPNDGGTQGGPLMVAIRGGHEGIVIKLLKFGANPDLPRSLMRDFWIKVKTLS